MHKQKTLYRGLVSDELLMTHVLSEDASRYILSGSPGSDSMSCLGSVLIALPSKICLDAIATWAVVKVTK